MNENSNDNVEVCNMCRCCLRTNTDLIVMPLESVIIYRSLVDTMSEESLFICYYCDWVFRKLRKFQKQCQQANIIMRDSIIKHKNYNFNSIHNYIKTKPVTTDYYPKNSQNDYNYEKNLNNDNTNEMIDNNDMIYDNGNNDVQLMDTENSFNDIDSDVFVSSIDNELIFEINEDRSELRSLRKRKKRGSKNTRKRETKNRNSKSKIPDGFTSRMVRETDEYVVIKLTKEQVLNELKSKSEADIYQRSPYKCDKCVKGFNFEDVLNKHMEKHSPENGSFVCELCTQRCPSAVSLRGHIKSHTTRYKCKVCDTIKISRQHLLEHHSITHSGQATTYTCDTCQFHTNKRTVMQRHVRSHSSTERHACHQCGKLFSSIDSLRVHTIRHDKSSKIQCSLCDNQFIYQSSLNRHLARVHHNNDYYCVECDVRFKSSESLKLHFKKAKFHRDNKFIYKKME